MSWIELAERLDAKARTKIREILGESSSVPIIEDNVDKISIVGSRGGWFTRGGTRIHAPNSYAKCGWSNMLYQRSTRQILVPIGTTTKSTPNERRE